MVTKFLQRTLLASALLLGGLTVFGQAPKKTAVKQISYTFEGEDGTNASAVIWASEHNLYITGIAGNPSFPLEGFRSTGNNVFATVTDLDLRGMWYDAKKDRLYANSAGEAGWYWVQLGEKGMPDGYWQNVCEGQNQPDFQTVLTSTGKMVVGYMDGSLYYYNAKNGKFKKEVVTSGYTGSTFNLTTVGYTGNSKYPLALLDAVEGKIVYFNLKGENVGVTSLPDDAVLSEMFRFSFANGMAWLYDVDTRTWTAYKVFE
jgi:hypothetical protein